MFFRIISTCYLFSFQFSDAWNVAPTTKSAAAFSAVNKTADAAFAAKSAALDKSTFDDDDFDESMTLQDLVL